MSCKSEYRQRVAGRTSRRISVSLPVPLALLALAAVSRAFGAPAVPVSPRQAPSCGAASWDHPVARRGPSSAPRGSRPALPGKAPPAGAGLGAWRGWLGHRSRRDPALRPQRHRQPLRRHRHRSWSSRPAARPALLLPQTPPGEPQGTGNPRRGRLARPQRRRRTVRPRCLAPAPPSRPGLGCPARRGRRSRPRQPGRPRLPPQARRPLRGSPSPPAAAASDICPVESAVESAVAGPDSPASGAVAAGASAVDVPDSTGMSPVSLTALPRSP